MASDPNKIPNYNSTRLTGGGTSGTLSSRNLFQNPNIPRTSQAQGLSGTDGRGYTRQVGQNEIARNALEGMLDRGGSYLTNARQRGLEQANRRGMLNSSIAAGSAERSALEAATPFAMQEADAYQRAQTENLGFMNQNLMQERDLMNRMTMEQMGIDAQRASAADNLLAQERSLANQYRMFQENLAYEGEQAGLNRAHDFGMSDMGYRQDLGRMGYQFDFQSREADRDLFRNMALQDNQFSNQRYNDTQQQIMNSQIGRSDAAYAIMLQQIYEDPSTSLQDMDGFYQWANTISNQQIEDMITRHLGGG